MSFLEKIGFAKKKPVTEISKINEVEKNDDEQLEASGEVSPEVIQELDNLKNEAEDLNKVIDLNPEAANEKVKNSKGGKMTEQEYAECVKTDNCADCIYSYTLGGTYFKCGIGKSQKQVITEIMEYNELQAS